jgi:hypothetical protein
VNRRLRRAKWARVLRLEPGDVVLLEVPTNVTLDQCEAIKAQWKRALPDVPMVVLVGPRASVLRGDDERKAVTSA